MVVPEEVNPDNTTTETTKKETSSPLTLDYSLPTSEEVKEQKNEITPIDILSETEIKDEIVEEKNESPKSVTLFEEKGIESGVEIHYTSMKLKQFPIRESNISSYEKEIEQIGLNSTTVYVGKTPLLNTNVKIISFNKFKIIEFKTREFKIGLSIKLEGDTIRKDGDYFRYEIFSKLKNSRLISVAEILRNIFSGEEISFKINDLFGKIIFENPIQSHKFGMIIETTQKYEGIEKNLKVSKSKAFSETAMDFYTIHLLDSYISGKTTFNSWLNYKIENNHSINSGDSLVFIKDHILDFRGINYILREKLIVKDCITEKDILSQNNSVVGYRKLVEIQLEKIEK